jgi:hypothetical protein
LAVVRPGFTSSVFPVPSSTCRPRSGRASYPIGLAGSQPRMSESQSIELSQRPCARPPTCSNCDIETGKSPSNVIGQKHLPSVTKIPQDRLSNRSQSDASRKNGESPGVRDGRGSRWLALHCFLFGGRFTPQRPTYRDNPEQAKTVPGPPIGRPLLRRRTAALT